MTPGGIGDIEAWAAAIGILLLPDADLTSYGRQRRERAAQHLERRLDRYFDDRPRVQSEAQFMALLKGVAGELRDAGQALEKAAQRFKNLGGQGLAANDAYRASQRAQRVADDLVGA
jgi:hypothetical protein